MIFFLQAALAAGQGCESPVQGPCRRWRSAVEEKSAVEQLSAAEGLSAQELEQRLDTMYNQVILASKKLRIKNSEDYVELR